MTPSAAPIVFVSRQRLVGRTNGSSAYLLDLAETCRLAGFSPILLQPTPRVAGRWPFLRLSPEMATFEDHRIRGLIRIGHLFVSPWPRVWLLAAWAILARVARQAGMRSPVFADRPFPYVVAEPWRDADRRWLARAAGRYGRVAIAVADYMFCAPALAEVPGIGHRAVVMHDLFHRRDGGAVDTVAAVDAETERNLLGAADTVIAIQAGEAEWVAENLPQATVILAPMASPIAKAIAVGDDDHLLFVGSNTGPNIAGLQWFIDTVWPVVKAVRPGVRLDVAGTVGWSFAGNNARDVRFLGMVDDLGALYERAGVVISPLTFGSGLKIKLVEAMARGKAVVATPVTLQGVEDEVDGAVVRAETADEFAAGVVALTGDAPARTALAEAALACARAHFGRTTAHASFAAWLAADQSEAGMR